MNLRRKRNSTRIIKGSLHPIGYFKLGFKDIELAVPFGRLDCIKIRHYGNEQFLLECYSEDVVVHSKVYQYKDN